MFWAALLRARSITSARWRSSVVDRAADRVTSRAPDAVTVAALAVVLISASLIFFSLDQRILWIDGGRRPRFGRSILDRGVPTAFDGRNVISQELGREYGPDYVWRWTPWLDKYLAAAAFAVLGYRRSPRASVRGARSSLRDLRLSVGPGALPRPADRCPRDGASRASVPFILHVRQCRYHSPAILCTIWSCTSSSVWRADSGAVAGFVTAMTLLFQSSILNAAATAVALVPACS